MVTLKTIKAFFSEYKFTKDVLILNKCTNIKDLEKYVIANIKILECNSGNKVYLPYFDRLKQVYTLINKNKNKPTD